MGLFDAVTDIGKDLVGDAAGKLLGGGDTGAGEVRDAGVSKKELRKAERRARRETRKNQKRRARLRAIEEATGLRATRFGTRVPRVQQVSAPFEFPGFAADPFMPVSGNFDFDTPLLDQFIGGGVQPVNESLRLDCGNPTFFNRANVSGCRTRSLVPVMKPNGNTTWYRHVGTPILFTGDLTTKKRVEKVASRARRGRR